jgi:regulator of sirC expression with transglutaminase-like and TPR domain
VISEQLLHGFTRVALSSDPDLAVAALMIARLERPRLDAGPYIEQLETLGREAARRVDAARAPIRDAPADVDPDGYARVAALNDYLFRDQRFVGNNAQYEDPRNSFLNEVLDRRTGIPITLAVVYMEVARRAGVPVEGVNFPGHFLVRCRARQRFDRDLIIDAFHGGALLSEDACRVLLRRHVGEDAVWDEHLLGQATKPQILGRMLLNLKRVYMKMHSYPQARDATELLLAVDPSAATELRDRGLLAFHLNDFAAALRDLQSYLRLSSRSEIDQEGRDEQAQIWEHIKSIRRRVASLN